MKKLFMILGIIAALHSTSQASEWNVISNDLQTSLGPPAVNNQLTPPLLASAPVMVPPPVDLKEVVIRTT